MTNKYVKCPVGHKCSLTRNGEDIFGKGVAEFKCGICYKKGKFDDGAYVCRKEKC